LRYAFALTWHRVRGLDDGVEHPKQGVHPGPGCIRTQTTAKLARLDAA
jgi:hypothetical protein